MAQYDIPALVKKIQPAVVMIITYNEDGKGLGQGSGFFISGNGDIITNRHVFEGANRAEVKTSDGKIYTVKNIVAEDKDGDLLRISIDIPVQVEENHAKGIFLFSLKRLIHGRSVRYLNVSASIPEVGEKVVVIGNPFGLEQTVSDGIVSAVRDIPGFGNIIQITAPLSSGSSGSPVVNLKGEVIGVATFIFTKGQNLNFAIPGERVTKLAPGEAKTLAEQKVVTTEESLASAEGLYSKGLALSGWKTTRRRYPTSRRRSRKTRATPRLIFISDIAGVN